MNERRAQPSSKKKWQWGDAVWGGLGFGLLGFFFSMRLSPPNDGFTVALTIGVGAIGFVGGGLGDLGKMFAAIKGRDA